MSRFKEYLLNAKFNNEETMLIKEEKDLKPKEDYIVSAKPDAIVAFRLYFKAKNGTRLTKVISGKIVENNVDDKNYIVETRNGLKYAVPYTLVVWVKTGGRWPKGVYDEMKQGSIVISEVDEETDDIVQLDELEQ